MGIAMNAPTDTSNSSRLTLAHASTIVDVAIATAHERRYQPMTVVVLDAGGHLVACKREDNSGILRFDIAYGKAWGSLGMGRASRDLDQMAQQRPHFVASLTAVSGGRVVPVAGGVLVLGADSQIIGAVGISGDVSDADELCAIAGVHAAGLASIPAEAQAAK